LFIALPLTLFENLARAASPSKVCLAHLSLDEQFGDIRELEEGNK